MSHPKNKKLEELIAQSELSARRFARLVLAARGERSLRRWLDEGAPDEVLEWLEKDLVRLERRGNMLHLQILAPIDARKDRRGADGADRVDD